MRPQFDWLLLSAAASVLWAGGLNLLKAANRHLRAAAWYVLASLAAVVAAALLLRSTGRLADAGLALLLMDALTAAYLLCTASALVGGSTPGMLAQIVDPRPLMRRAQKMVSNVD